jgi:hypothetical protein
MARIDKYDPVDGGFRAPLAGAWAGQAAPIGVGLDVNGRVVPGAGQTGIVGVLCKPDAAAAGSVVDIARDAELVEFNGVPGTVYYAADADGAISTTDTGTVVGFTVEASRLIVGVAR